MFRKIPYSWYMITTNENIAKEKYELGVNDALKNIKLFDDFFNE